MEDLGTRGNYCKQDWALAADFTHKRTDKVHDGVGICLFPARHGLVVEVSVSFGRETYKLASPWHT